ncbi:MAG TPA: DNA repair protein RecN [Acidimicrobiales bacterium]|nr:DNA repair protein RecN [Acidimicrobiales bacterium]
MLTELAIRDLGVIVDVRVALGAGMTAVTGETGAGKTMLVEAIELLVGGRADGMIVRAGAAEAWVEGRFVAGDEEVVLARAVPATGRSRAYIDGRMAPVAALAEAGARLVDMHGQHAHQSLLAPAAQRAALDAFAGVDLAPVQAARRRVRDLARALEGLGGDERARAREQELLRFQLDELEAADLTDPDEDATLEGEEDRLADVAAGREAAAAAGAALTGDDGWSDRLGDALAAVANRPALAPLEVRLRSLAAEVADVAGELRAAAEGMDENPERLAAVRARRRLLRELRRKYGESLADVMAYALEARARLDDLEHHAARAEALEGERRAAEADEAAAEAAVGERRRTAAPLLAAAAETHLRELALPQARLVVRVGEDRPGDDVTFLLAANPGEDPLPLSKVASGGELARTMLALRLVLDQAPPTLVFDEVDAGIGGEAALAVGRRLAALAVAGDGPDRLRQVLVVTHLPQVAAFADNQLAVRKVERDGRAVAEVAAVDGEERVVELSRMLSGHAQSSVARDHAEELLSVAARDRGR